MANRPARHRFSHGFTLIELLVSITVMTLLVGGGIAAYQRFNDKQVVSSAAQQYISSFRQAQKKISVGDKPSGCTGVLQSYILQGSSNGFTVFAQCGSTVQTNTYILSGVTLSPENYTVTISDLGRNVSITPSPTLSVVSTLFTNTITISSTGEVTDNGPQPN